MKSYLQKNNIGTYIPYDIFKIKVPPRYLAYINEKLILSDLYITYDSLDNFYLETKCEECFLCKKNINTDIKEKKCCFNNIYNKILNENVINIINNNLDNLSNNNKIFMYETKINSDIYIYEYFHLCTECLSINLYNWYITYNNYPFLRVHGYNFIHNKNNYTNIDIKHKKILLDKIKNIKFPDIFICNYNNKSINLNMI
tara:strand:+ start:3328 stop:3927 length:600 start_codon:yes stop_codon:yes gene_type:complete